MPTAASTLVISGCHQCIKGSFIGFIEFYGKQVIYLLQKFYQNANHFMRYQSFSPKAQTAFEKALQAGENGDHYSFFLTYFYLQLDTQIHFS